METIIEEYSPGAVARAGEIIRRGGLVAFPTETVYGLGADAMKEDASSKIYAAKGRPSDNPLIVHIADMDSLNVISEDIPDAAYKLAQRYWPGPLTMIFRKKPIVPDMTTGGLNTVAVRMPDCPAALDIIRSGGGFVAAPSANTSGRPSPTCAEHVIEDLKGIIDMIVDGGPVSIGLESTIVDMTGKIPLILRPGYITEEDIRHVAGDVATDPGVLSAVSDKERPRAPGMKYRHYAPKASMVVVEGDNDRVVSYINGRIKELESEGKKCGVISSEDNKNSYICGIIKCAGARNRSDEVARNLYRILREFDKEDVAMILSESFNGGTGSTAVMNRLLKAAGHNIIRV
ncbi:MAG: threonylcarbamoyl-AMP synthase [Lachnospiraceae bacterium]|nr:threonylcarbamoyl-AMP synthase [Lachnospiraceae bacterium]